MQCALDEFVISGKPEVHSMITQFLTGKKLLKNVTLQILNFISVS